MAGRTRCFLASAILVSVVLVDVSLGQDQAVPVRGVTEFSVQVTPMRYTLGGPESARQFEAQVLQAAILQLGLHPVKVVTRDDAPRLVIAMELVCDDAQMPTCGYFVEVALRERVAVARIQQAVFATTWRSAHTGMFRGYLGGAREAVKSDIVVRVDQFAQAASGVAPR